MITSGYINNTIRDGGFASAQKGPELFRLVPELDQIRPTDNDVRRPQSEFIHRGEFVQHFDRERNFRPNFNQRVAPHNQTAIDSYQRTYNADNPEAQRQGRHLDLFL